MSCSSCVEEFANVYLSINYLEGNFNLITENSLNNYNQITQYIFQQPNIYNTIYYGYGNINTNNLFVNNNANINGNYNISNGNLIINNGNLILNNSYLVLGTNYGSNGQVIISNGSSLPPIWDSSLILGTPLTLSSTSASFTNLPSWVNQIVVTINGASTNGTTVPNILLGTSSGYVTTGYSGALGPYTGDGANYLSSNILLWQDVWTATNVFNSVITFYHMGSNIWVFRINTSLNNSAIATVGNGTITLASTLDRLQLTINGTQIFDSGTINISYQ